MADLRDTRGNGDDAQTVFIVEDNPDMRALLRRILEHQHLTVESFSLGEDLLLRFDEDRPGCILLDLRLPGMSGLEVQTELAGRGVATPIVFVTAYAEVCTAVEALKRGAFDFLEKPVMAPDLLSAVQRALDFDSRRRHRSLFRVDMARRLQLLTVREREVMEMMVAGKASKVIACDLGISERTVEVHRSRVMQKAGVSSVAALVQVAMTANGESAAGVGGLASVQLEMQLRERKVSCSLA